MNRHVEVVTERYIRDLKHSDIYRKYRKELENIKKDEELFRRVTEYRQQNFEIQQQFFGDELNQKMMEFEERNIELRDNPQVDAFLKAELALCRMVQWVNDTLIERLDFQ